MQITHDIIDHSLILLILDVHNTNFDFRNSFRCHMQYASIFLVIGTHLSKLICTIVGQLVQMIVSSWLTGNDLQAFKCLLFIALEREEYYTIQRSHDHPLHSMHCIVNSQITIKKVTPISSVMVRKFLIPLFKIYNQTINTE